MNAINPAIEAIDSYVSRSLAERRTPGLALALTDRDRLLYAGHYGFADLKRGTPMAETTLFQIGSITKSFTALALMQLVDQGRLQLAAPLRTYLPWFSIRSAYAPITVHHLLTHSAGLPANRDDGPASAFMAYALRERAAAWPPGERFYYSNVGYQVLHVLLEQLAGQAYPDIIRRRILDPLDMRASRPAITLTSRPAQAVGYIPPFDDRPWHPSQGLVEAPHFEYGVGDGSIQSTASELAAYVRMLLRGGLGPHGPLLSEPAFARFTAPHVPVSEDAAAGHYAYGLSVTEAEGGRVLSHGGGMVGFHAWMAADVTHGIGVAVLANAPAAVQSIGEYALQAVRATLAGAAIPAAPAARDPFQTDHAADYAGAYATPEGDTLRFRAEAERLTLLAPAGRELPSRPAGLPLEAVGQDRFYTPDPDYDGYVFQFGRDDTGRVVEVFHGPAWYASPSYAGPGTFDLPEDWRAFVGRYRSYSPWFSYFEVFARKGSLVACTPAGDDLPAGERPLTQTAPAVFRIGPDPSPETLQFQDVLDGRALRAEWSGHAFFRTPPISSQHT
jgi:CubicO group peptidase (beta-lactamase class C family)